MKKHGAFGLWHRVFLDVLAFNIIFVASFAYLMAGGGLCERASGETEICW